MLRTVCVLLLLMSIMLLFSVLPGNAIPTGEHILAFETRIADPPRYPQWLIDNGILYLFWQRKSKGQKDVQTVVLNKGDKTAEKTVTYQPPGLKPITVEYAVIRKEGIEPAFPLKQASGKIELIEPINIFAPYSLVQDVNNNVLLGFESDLEALLHNQGTAISLNSYRYVNDKFDPLGTIYIPPKSRLPFTEEQIIAIKEKEGLNDQQIVEKYGYAAAAEILSDYSKPSMTRAIDGIRLSAVGLNRNIATDKGDNIWFCTSADNGQTWTKQYLFHNLIGDNPGIVANHGKLFLTAIQRLPRYPVGLKRVVLGYWPDEFPERAAWPFTGPIILRSWQETTVPPEKSTIVVNDPLCIQGSLAFRQDGVMALTYVRSNDTYGGTSLWLTTSKDGIKWETPQQLTDNKNIYRDVDTIFYQDDLWIAYIAREGRTISNIYICQYHLPL
jgi:hypothetical protein